MNGRLLPVALVWLWVSTGAWAETKLAPFSYREGFEGTPPAVTLWAKNGDATENFNGVTEEQAFEGKKSYKLDVTLTDGSYHYWGVPLKVPCEGRLKIGARVLVAPGTTASVGFGSNMIYPPSPYSGCGSIVTFDKPTSGWQTVEGDLVEIGMSGRDSVVPRHAVNLTGADVGAILDRWALFICGKPGTRAVVYVDDVRIEGEIPGAEAYRQELAQRYAAAAERFKTQVSAWQRDLGEARQAVAALTAPPAALREAADTIRKAVADAEQLVTRLAKGGSASHADLDTVRQALVAARTGPQMLRTLAESMSAGRAFAVLAPPQAIANRQLVSGLPLALVPVTELTCAGAAGEYEPVVADVYAAQDVVGLRVGASELKGAAGTIPASAVDVCVVKAWFQGKGGIGRSTTKVLKYELLLKDDALVRVDLAKEENYLRSTAPDGTATYLLCSGPTSENLADVRPLDAPVLQPVAVPAGTTKAFWFTVHIPDEAKPGIYTGTVQFASANGSVSLPLRVTVHPFALKPSRLIYSIYYRACLAPDGKPRIDSERRSEEQYRAEIADMKAHGVLYPSNYQGWDERLLPRVMEIRREVGMPGGPFFNLGLSTGNRAEPAALRQLQDGVRQWVAYCRPFGYTDVYFYGIDEASGDRLTSQRQTWQAVQDAGGKTFVACYRKTFEAMGKLLNCAVFAGPPDPEEAKKWHSVGSVAFCYANPQVGVEEPETYRRNFGLVLWKAGFDGAMDYAYQHGFHHVWNDFDDPSYRDHNFTYPTVNGVVGTVEWEGFREGVDDVRYVTTLEEAIRAAPAAKQAAAKQAQDWLDQLDPRSADLDATRRQMVEWILKLQ